MATDTEIEMAEKDRTRGQSLRAINEYLDEETLVNRKLDSIDKEISEGKRMCNLDKSDYEKFEGDKKMRVCRKCKEVID